MRKHIHLGYGKCVHTKQIHLGHSHHHHGCGNDFQKIHHGGIFRTMDGKILGEGHRGKKLAPLKFLR